jgi:hypothetical protein
MATHFTPPLAWPSNSTTQELLDMLEQVGGYLRHPTGLAPHQVADCIEFFVEIKRELHQRGVDGMSPAEMRFQMLWHALFGGPMFPAKPLKYGGVIQYRRPYRGIPWLLVRSNGRDLVNCVRYEGTPLQAMNALTAELDIEFDALVNVMTIE